MSGGLFPTRSTGPGFDPEAAGRVEEGRRSRSLRRWRARAVQWRAAAVAERAFGGPVQARLRGEGALGFQALVELGVPFSDLASHRASEARFLGAAARDDVLAAAPMVVVFRPTPEDR